MTIADPGTRTSSGIRLGDQYKSIFLGDVAEDISIFVDQIEESVSAFEASKIEGMSPASAQLMEEALEEVKSNLLNAISNFEQDLVARAS